MTSSEDEYGLPSEWRRTPPWSTLLEDTAEDWAQFERWCESHGLRAFPASIQTVIRFLMERPVQGAQLYDVWSAIEGHHEAYYWHADANPAFKLRVYAGVEVKPDGTVVLPEEVVKDFGPQ